MAPAPHNVGIAATYAHFPSSYVSQAALEKFDGVAPGKYTAGLGQTNMAFCGLREDITSLMLTAVSELLDRYGLSPSDIGRLEVGTETLVDKSKSGKTALMGLFGRNTGLEGVTSVNACYGGTAALLDRLDRIVVTAGGRFYLAKDARMSRAVFDAAEPRAAAFRGFRAAEGLAGAFGSTQSERLGL